MASRSAGEIFVAPPPFRSKIASLFWMLVFDKVLNTSHLSYIIRVSRVRARVGVRARVRIRARVRTRAIASESERECESKREGENNRRGGVG